MNKSISSSKSSNLRRSPVSRACLTLAMMVAGAAVAPGVYAGAGFGERGDANAAGEMVRVPTYYAHSPSGKRLVNPPEAPAGYDGNTGAALRKFVDPLPLVGEANAKTLADGVTSKYIPVAKAEKWVNPNGVTTGDDYFEIAVVQYTEKLHTDLAKPTLLRGYVQLMTPGLAALGVVGKSFTTVDGRVLSVVDTPHYLGPTIVANKGVATRVKFHNLLPVGRYDAATGNRNGDLFIPVDKTLPGAAYGPDGVFEYTQNRAQIHLHGGDTPWISDGTPHQWIAPAGERAILTAAKAADPAAAAVNIEDYMKGPSAKNVPDMVDGGDGTMTYYFPNNQSGRLMWYHDHSFGLTRLNVYAGQAAPYVLEDAQQAAILATIPGFPDAAATIPLIYQDKTFVPKDIALQDAKWNTTKGGAAKPVWGTEADLWYPHVYEMNQNPDNVIDGTNTVGRWDWGPYFWPVFPAMYEVPSGHVDDATLTPEAWMDTPLVNGVAYPTLTVDAKAYRFKILNAANDRFVNLSMFVADSALSTIRVTNGGSGYTPTTVVTLTKKSASDPGTGATAEAVIGAGGVITGVRITNAGTGYTGGLNVFFSDVNKAGGGMATAQASMAVNTEVKMVPAVPAIATGMGACATDANGKDMAPPYAPACWPSTWPTDGRDGGVPDPASSGPMFYQIGSEGGLIPKVAEIPAAPMGYEYNRRSVTVLGTYTHGLFMGNAERADVVVDFSNFAGQTLIVYSDAPAPVPAFDPRNDHWTGKGDESAAGSVEGVNAGYGPNTRTIMQIKVADNAANFTPLDTGVLKTKVSEAYGATQAAPVVAQSAYNEAFGKSWSDTPTATGEKAFANIFTGTLQEPAFQFTPGNASAGLNLLTSVKVTTQGSGYVTPPAVTIDAPAPGVAPATAKATLKVSQVNITNSGSGYVVAPTVSFVSNVGGNGASGVATLKVLRVNVTAGGAGYDAATSQVIFSKPTYPTVANGGVQAEGTVTVNALGRVTGIVVTNPGVGYMSAPTATITGGNGLARATTVAGVGKVVLTSSNPLKPSLAGGGGYVDMNQVQVTFAPPPAGTTAAATVRGSVFDVTLVNPGGADYLNVPSVTLAAPPAAPAGTTFTSVPAVAAPAAGPGSILVKNKAIQELFDPTYGRMNATLGIELPFTSAMTQTTIPLGYVDPVTEEIDDGETQIWKITHNGVDAHPVHFHLVNVQLINRIGWDGTVKPPLDNEYGWKETVRMNPLEDIVVAVRAKKPTLPGFGLPFSKRRADPSQPLNTPAGFTQVDVFTGNPKTVVNEEVDYGWEYVWHCHILGHEENDFMRPIKFNANEAAPAAPTITSALDGSGALVVAGGVVNLTWIDNATTEYQYEVYRTPILASGLQGTPVLAKTLLANSISFSETMPLGNWIYSVVAVGANGVGKTDVPVAVSVAAPTGALPRATSATQVQLNWVDASTNETRFVVQRAMNGGPFAVVSTPASPNTLGVGGARSVTLNGQVAGNTYDYSVAAQMVFPGGVVTSPATLTTIAFAVPSEPLDFAVDAANVVRGTGALPAGNGATTAQNIVPVSWTNSVTPANGVPATSYRVEWSSNGFVTVAGNKTVPASATGTGSTTVTVARGTPGTTNYSFRVRGNNAVGNGLFSAQVTGVTTK